MKPIDRRRFVTLASSIETIRRDCVPEMRAKLKARFEPSDAVNESEPLGALELNAFSATAAISGTASSGRPIMLVWSAGAAITTPVLSTSSDEIPGRPPRLAMIFDSQSILMQATTTASSSGLIAATG